MQTYTWQATDDLLMVALAFFSRSQFADVSALVDAIRANNAVGFDWRAVPQGTRILIPLG